MSAARTKWFCLLAVVSLLGVANVAQSYLAETQVLVRAASIDLDAREDEPGIQYEATTLKNIPLRLVVVSPLVDSSLRVSAQLQGPGMSEPQEVIGALGGYLELPPLVVPGSYQLSAVQVLSTNGNVLTQRDPRLPVIELTVLDELLVTSVTSRPLDTDEINDKGIVIDEDNFTVLNFAVGMVVDSEEVSIDLPVALPRQTNEMSGSGSGGGGAPIILDKSDLDFLNIPNLSVSGFTLSRPEESASEDDFSAPISGLMIIPGNIAYLNQFFSVLLAATNIAGEQTSIVLENPQATIRLPTGDDGILSGDGDDPLRMAELEGGQPQTQPLLGDHADGIHPQSTHQAEYLVEGLREGTHVVEFDLSGVLNIPGAPEGLPLEGVARGVVQVRNPTFTLNLSHPDVVRVDEPYRLYASVTNTSNAPANLFTLSLDPLGLMGARLADGETSSRSLETLAAGESREFVFELVAMINGEVTATVFLADPGINGAFLLRTGVGDTGIPLSPDTLVLPSTINALPTQPDLARAIVRLLGQAYSNATAPAGSLPVGMERVSASTVRTLGGEGAMQGLYAILDETPANVTFETALAFMGLDAIALAHELQTMKLEFSALNEALGAEVDPVQRGLLAFELEGLSRTISRLERSIESIEAFDTLKRSTLAGHAFESVVAEILRSEFPEATLAEIQSTWAQRFISTTPMHGLAIESAAPLRFEVVDGFGRKLEVDDRDRSESRYLPYAQRVDLDATQSATRSLIWMAENSNGTMTATIQSEVSTSVDVALVHPTQTAEHCGSEMTSIELSPGDNLVVQWNAAACQTLTWEIRRFGTAEESGSLVMQPVVDEAPTVVALKQWAMGRYPVDPMIVLEGDPHGRLMFLLMSEPLSEIGLPAINVGAVSGGTALVQPGKRLVAYFLQKPLGIESDLNFEVVGGRDAVGTVMSSNTGTLNLDPRRGPGAVVTGRVLDPRGEGIAFAQVQHRATVYCPMCNFGEGEHLDVVLSEELADINGEYRIEYALQNGFDNGAHVRVHATSPVTEQSGMAQSDVLYDGQDIRLNVIFKGYADIVGQLVDTSGDPLVLDHAPVINIRHLQGGENFLQAVDDDGGFAIRTHVGPVLIEARALVNGEIWSGITTVTVEEIESTTEVLVALASYSTFGRVEGRVLEAGGLSGAPDTKVFARANVFYGITSQGPVLDEAVVGMAMTDNDGYFTFSQVPAGPVKLYAYRESTWEEVEAQALVPAEDALVMNLVFPGSDGMVQGHVIDGSGTPVEFARVVAGPYETVTNGDGYFEISNLPRRAISVGAQAPDSRASASTGVNLEVDATAVVMLQFQAIGSVRGTVYASDGVTKLVDQNVQLWDEGVDGESSLGVLAMLATDAEGRYAFPAIPASNYSVRSVNESSRDGGQAVVSVVGDGDDHADVDIVYEGLGEVVGRVMQQQNSGVTPIMAPVKVWVDAWDVLTNESAGGSNYYVDFVEALKTIEGIEPEMIDAAYTSQTGPQPISKFYVKTRILKETSSSVNVDETDNPGSFSVSNVLSGAVRATAGNVFTSSAYAEGMLTKATPFLDLGDLVVNPSVGSLGGRVLMPDGETLLDKAQANLFYTGPGLEGQGQALNGLYEVAIVPEGSFFVRVATGAVSCPDSASDCALPTELHGTLSGSMPAGAEVEMDIRLRGVGDVEVWVVDEVGQPVPNAAVKLTTAFQYDGPQISALSDSTGKALLRHVVEGPYAIEVTLFGTSRVATVAAEMRVNPPVDHKDFIQMILPEAAGQSATVVGSVSGTIYSASGTAVTEPVSLTLRRAGYVSMVVSDMTNGTFSFDTVPEGAFTISAYETVYGRRGFAMGQITADNTALVTDINLIGFGDIFGTVQNSDGSPVNGALVRASPTGASEAPRVTLTGADGRFAFSQVPMGEVEVTATDASGNLETSSRTQIDQEGELVEVTLTLERGVGINGLVTLPGGNPAVAAQITISDGSSNVVETFTGADGVFTVPQVLSPKDYHIEAFLSARGAQQTAALAQVEDSLDVTLILSAAGSTNARLLDANGAEVFGAAVTLTSESPYLVSRQGATAANGTVSFNDVPVGAFDVSFRHGTEIIQRVTRSGVVTTEGEIVSLGDVTLAPSTVLSGAIYSPQGLPVPSASVYLKSSGLGTSLYRATNSEGAFEFPAVEAGSYTVEAQLESPRCQVTQDKVLDGTQPSLELGVLTFDCEQPFVASSNPLHLGVGVNAAGPFEVVFSEVVVAESISDNTVSLWEDENRISIEIALDGTNLAVTPLEPLSEMVVYELRLEGERDTLAGEVQGFFIADTQGLPLNLAQTLVFTTGDSSSPLLTSTSPEDGTSQMPSTQAVVFQFSEAVDAATAVVSAISDGAALNIDSTWSGNQTQLTVAPELAWPDNRRVHFNIAAGLQDLAGNATTQAMGLLLTTSDVFVRPVSSLGASGTSKVGYNMTLTPSFEALPSQTTESVGYDDVTELTYQLGDGRILTANQSPFAVSFTVSSEELNSEGNLPVSVTSRDALNNQAFGSFVMDVQPNVAPQISFLNPQEWVGTHATGFTVGLALTDDLALDRAEIVVSGIAYNGVELDLSNAGASTERYTFIPIEQDTPDGEQVLISARAYDAEGLASEVIERTVVLRDTIAPAIERLVPASNVEVMPGEAFDMILQIADASGLASLSATVSDGGQGYTYPINVSADEGTFILPLVPPPNESVQFVITVSAEDQAGNSVQRQYYHQTADMTPPEYSWIWPSLNSPIELSATFNAGFSEKVGVQSVLDALSIRRQDNGEAVTVVPTNATSGSIGGYISGVSFTVSGLEYATTYIMTLDAGFVDQAGNESIEPYSMTFVTENAPSVGLLWPTSNQTISDAPVDIELWLAFDETISTGFVQSGGVRFISEAPADTVTAKVVESDLTGIQKLYKIRPLDTLLPSTDYTLTFNMATLGYPGRPAPTNLSIQTRDHGTTVSRAGGTTFVSSPYWAKVTTWQEVPMRVSVRTRELGDLPAREVDSITLKVGIFTPSGSYEVTELFSNPQEFSNASSPRSLFDIAFYIPQEIQSPLVQKALANYTISFTDGTSLSGNTRDNRELWMAATGSSLSSLEAVRENTCQSITPASCASSPNGNWVFFETCASQHSPQACPDEVDSTWQSTTGSFALNNANSTYSLTRAVRKAGLYEVPTSCLPANDAGLSMIERCNALVSGNQDFGACSVTASGCRCHVDSYVEQSTSGSFTYEAPPNGTMTLNASGETFEQNVCQDTQVMRVIVDESGLFPDTTLLVPDVSLMGGGN